MPRELREVWRIRCPMLKDKIIADAARAEMKRADLEAGGWETTLERLPLLTERDAAVLAAAEKFTRYMDEGRDPDDMEHAENGILDAVRARRQGEL
jgi:hypothetical protein